MAVRLAVGIGNDTRSAITREVRVPYDLAANPVAITCRVHRLATPDTAVDIVEHMVPSCNLLKCRLLSSMIV